MDTSKNVLGLKKLQRHGVIEYAMQWTGFNSKEMEEFTGVKNIKKNTLFTVKTKGINNLDKIIYVMVNDWVIQNGETGFFFKVNDKNRKKKYSIAGETKVKKYDQVNLL